MAIHRRLNKDAPADGSEYVRKDGYWKISTGGGGGVTDHGALTGLADDDHTQYHTDARGDARYAPLAGYNNANWDTAYGWGNHATAGYLTSYTETDPTVSADIKAITATQIGNWDTAYGWGNHASAGYLTSYTETNNLTAAVTWANVPIANIPTGTTSSTVSLGNHTHEGTAIVSTGETAGKVLQADGDNTCSWVTLAGGGDALTTNPLSQFAATTSLQLKGVISDETGSGPLVFGTSPTLTTPTLGGALAAATYDIDNVGTLDFGSSVGAKIYYYSSDYYTGIEASTLYQYSGNLHRWYINTAPDGGTSDTMELASTGLTVNGTITGTGAVTGSNLNVSNWDTAYGWGDHTSGGYAVAAGAYHDGFSDFVANEHIDWTNATSAILTTGNIEGNYLTSSGGLVLADAYSPYTGDCAMRIGGGRTSTNYGYSYLDLVGDSTYPVYGTRLIRNNGGPNTTSALQHRGTGNLTIATVDSGADLAFQTASSERMRIDSDGYVGIGTTAPASRLQVHSHAQFAAGLTLKGYTGANNAWARLNFEPRNSTDTGYQTLFMIYATASGLTMRNDNSSGSLIFDGGSSTSTQKWQINHVEKMRMTSDGYLAIGRTTADEELHVADTVKADVGFQLDYSGGFPSTENEYIGNTEIFTAATTIAAGDAVELVFGTPAKVRLADADNATPAVGIAVTAATSGNAVTVLTRGLIKITGITGAAFAYASNTGGAITSTKPTTSGDYVKILGFGMNTDQLYVHPEFNSTVIP